MIALEAGTHHLSLWREKLEGEVVAIWMESIDLVRDLVHRVRGSCFDRARDIWTKIVVRVSLSVSVVI